MRRRAFLASALTAGTSITAGCGFIESRTEHTDPTVELDDNPQNNTKYLVFRKDGADLATVGVSPPGSSEPSEFGASVSHGVDTELQSLTQRFSTPDSDETPPKIALQGPFMDDYGPPPSVSVFRDNTAAVVKVHRFGGLADETVYINLLVTRWPASAHRLVVESSVELVEPGLTDQTHVLDGQLEFKVTTETEADEPTDDTPNSSE
ncbi:hypothetical protein ACFQDG_16445 [Natronoarchaeum mannanilyticum]|uniref:DUF8121 domain-containing protein n=1 Tax=Natronoarchaeum mannanilyticum TaxID=926360 RepID=A0AAV3T6H4_9EURY